MHHQVIDYANQADADGNPTGGSVSGLGLSIRWQDRPLEAGAEENGTFVETVLRAVLQRMEHYQATGGGKFRCRENALVITKLEEALHWIGHRTKDRQERGVKGTNEA